MKEFQIVYLSLALLIGFGLLWALLHRFYRKSIDSESYTGKDLELDSLTSLKGKISEEEYRQIQGILVKKMTRSEDSYTAKKEIHLADLEAQHFLGLIESNKDQSPTKGQDKPNSQQ